MKNKLLMLLALFALQAGPAFAIDEGFEYKLIEPPVQTSDKNKVEVVELFWYGCPHCYDFEPTLNKWLKDKPDNVKFVRVPAIFRDSWLPHARAYYTAQALGVLDKTHGKFFDAVHKQRRRLQTEKDIADFFERNGVSKEEFTKAWNSFVVQSRVKRAITLTRRYGITGVPSIIINGKYRTSARDASSKNPAAASNEVMLEVVDELIANEMKQPATATK